MKSPSFLISAAIALVGSPRATGADPAAGLLFASGARRDDVQAAVDAVLERNGPPDGYRRTRRSRWEEGGASMTCAIEDDGTGVLLTETWVGSPSLSSLLPDAWRKKGIGDIPVGFPVEVARADFARDGMIRSGGARDEAWHGPGGSLRLGFEGDGTVTSYEVSRDAQDWDEAEGRCYWLRVLGERALDEEIEAWTWDGAPPLVRTGDRVAGEWRVSVGAPPP